MECTGTCYCLGTIRYVKFRNDMLDVEFDRMQAEHQMLRDLLVGETFCYQLEHVMLPFTQQLIESRVWR